MFKGGTIHYGADPREYHALQKGKRGEPTFIMSRGELAEFSICPQRWVRGVPNDKTDFTEWGNLIDCIVLTPERFEDVYAVAPETYEAEPKKKGDKPEVKPWNWNATVCKEWRDARIAEGKEVVKAADAAAAWLAAKRIGEDSILSDFIECSQKQVMVQTEWVDEETGIVVPCKILVDLVPLRESIYGHGLGDFKTSVSAAPKAWSKTVSHYRLYYQAAFYLDVWHAVTGEKRTEWYHPVQESEPPYETARRKLTSEFIQIGRAEYTRNFLDYCYCLKTGEFNGYEGIHAEGSQVVDGWREVHPEPYMFFSEP